MPGDHYFTSSPGSDLRLKRIRVALAGREVEVETSSGVFSPDRIDVGTAVLLGNVPAPPPSGHLLDLGCGWGPIALTLALESPHSTVWAVDVNERALDLVRANADHLSIPNIMAVKPEEVPGGIEFATVWSNPPIRVGKNELHSILATWLPRLAPRQNGWLVVQRNLGADSLHRWLQATFPDELAVTRHATSKGYRVLRVRRRSGTGMTEPIELISR